MCVSACTYVCIVMCGNHVSDGRINETRGTHLSKKSWHGAHVTFKLKAQN